MSTSTDIVSRFRGLRVVVIGDAMLDSYVRGTATRLCSEGPVPVVSKTGEERCPGGGANTAANLRALGAEVVYLGIVGADTASHHLRSSLRDHGVDDRWLIEDPDVETIHKLRISAGNQYIVRLDTGESWRPAAAMEERLLNRLTDALPSADVVVISDYGYGVASNALIERLRDLRLEQPLVVDAKDVRRFRHVGATLLTPNHLEARNAVEPAVRPNHEIQVPDLEEIGRRLFGMVDATNLAVTMAEHGVLLFSRDGTTRHLAAHPVADADPVGAGDTFMAAAALALGAGAPCTTAVRIGIEAAGIAVSKCRTAVVEQDELLRRLNRRDEVIQPEVAPLAARLEADRADGRKVVFTNGVFDLLHPGHVQFLRAARELGDILVVAVNSDASARRLKGESRPITGEQDRLALVAALDTVDYAILFEDDTPSSLISALRPDVHVKGSDYEGKELPEADALREVGALSVILPQIGDSSTTGVIDRILATAPNGKTAHNGSRAQV